MGRRMDRWGAALGRSFLAVTVIGAVSIWAAPAASALKTFNRYAVDVAGSMPAGGSAAIGITVTNEGIGILNKVTITAPTGLTVSGATTTRGKLTRSGNVLALRKLVLPPGHTMGLSVSASAACGTASPQTWSSSGAKGILTFPFRLDAANSHLDTTIDGACHLAFVAQPADGAPGEPITDTPSDPSGGPVTVGLFDGSDAPITTGSPVSVSVAIGTNPGGGSLSGTTSAGSTAGVASFADLSIDAPGDGYTLDATATGFVGASSDPFDLAGVIQQCEANVDCQASLESSDGVTSAAINAIADPSSPILTASFTDEGLDCDGYDEQSPSTLVFNVTTSREKLVTIMFDTGIEDYYVNPNHYQVCYQSPTPFAERFHGDLVTTGVLPECALPHYESNPPPCVLHRYVYGSVVSITFQAPEGDPKGRV
jgi:hypothetical protein